MLKDTLNDAYDELTGNKMAQAYNARHGIASAPVLTITDNEMAQLVAESLAGRISGRTVVEIGGGLGLLALHMGRFAKRVYCIEANPMWATSFTVCLLAVKPKHVSYLFGAADEFVGQITADVAVFCTHSGVDGMAAAARLFAPEVIDVYGKVIAGDPSRFDPLAVALRPIA